jgi:hypothetical protein
MKLLPIACALSASLLLSCSVGKVYVAHTEAEAIRSSYQDQHLSQLSNQHQPFLKALYERLTQEGLHPYPNGIGFTRLSGEGAKKYDYLLVEVRPPEILFDQRNTTAEVRFNEVLHHQFEKNLNHMKEDDLQIDGVDGLAFGLYWPVRDFSKCDQNGGFLEYITVYFTKAEFLKMKAKQLSFAQAANNGQVVTSLNLQPAKFVKISAQ